MSTTKFLAFLTICLLSLPALAAESITGLWTTIDDESNQPKSVVYVYEHGGKFYGRIVKLFKNHEKKIVNSKGDVPILGADIVWGMKKDGAAWEGGKILDPNKGKVYSCKMWLENGNLMVRGKIGPFGRNQTWKKNTDESLKPTGVLTPKIVELK